MIFSREAGEYEVGCDRCPEVEEFEVDGWYPLLDAMGDAGWSYRKNHRVGQWEHYCPECTETEGSED